MTLPTSSLGFTLNGEVQAPQDVPQGLMMVDFLHEYVGTTGVRFGCGIGECRACTVLVETPSGSEEVRTCITGAHFFNGKSIRTIEGIAGKDANGERTVLSPVQQSFLDHFSFQCSYCTPGFVMGATALVEELAKFPVPKSTVEAVVQKALEAHLCRCTGYVRYFEAVRDVVLATPGLTVEG